MLLLLTLIHLIQSVESAVRTGLGSRREEEEEEEEEMEFSPQETERLL